MLKSHERRLMKTIKNSLISQIKTIKICPALRRRHGILSNSKSITHSRISITACNYQHNLQHTFTFLPLQPLWLIRIKCTKKIISKILNQRMFSSNDRLLLLSVFILRCFFFFLQIYQHIITVLESPMNIFRNLQTSINSLTDATAKMLCAMNWLRVFKILVSHKYFLCLIV